MGFCLKWYEKHSRFVAGLDEAGRGPLAGPVVAAAVVLDFSRPIPGLRDSKKLSQKKRSELFEQIVRFAIAFGICEISAYEIDQTNILAASLNAMARAFGEAQKKVIYSFSHAFVDGNQEVSLPRDVVQETVIGGDGIWPPIMAASILAKVTRDQIMVDAAKKYPGYGFEKHKGYGTKVHILALEKLGPSPIHRRSFRAMNQLALF